MSLTLAPRHRCLRGIPPRGCLINVKVISRREGLSLGEKKEGGWRVAEAEGATGWGGTLGVTHVLSCASLPACALVECRVT